MKKPTPKKTAKRITKTPADGAGRAIEAVFEAYPQPVKSRLLALRRLIFDTAKTTKASARWRKPSNGGSRAISRPRARAAAPSGSTSVKAEAGGYAVYFHCQTDLVETFRERYPELRYGGNRSILLDAGEKLPEAALRHCIALALTYHARKRKAAK